MPLLRNLIQNRASNLSEPSPPNEPTVSITSNLRRPISEGVNLKNVLDAGDNRHEAPRSGNEYAHLTSLVNACARKLVLMDQGNTPVHQRVTGGHRVMWKMGRFIERHIRDTYIREAGTDAVMGLWTCRCGETVTRPMIGSLLPTCSVCSSMASRYMEYTVKDHEYLIAGNPDLIVLERDGALTVVEIKSMNGPDFNELEAPLGAHSIQAAAYRRLLLTLGHNVSDRVVVLYCTKLFVFGSPYKEFVVDPHSPVIQNSLEDIWRVAALRRDYRSNGLPPKRPSCDRSGFNAKPAVSCPLVAECFARS